MGYVTTSPRILRAVGTGAIIRGVASDVAER